MCQRMNTLRVAEPLLSWCQIFTANAAPRDVANYSYRRRKQSLGSGIAVSKAAPFLETLVHTKSVLFGRSLLHLWKKPRKKPSDFWKSANSCWKVFQILASILQMCTVLGLSFGVVARSPAQQKNKLLP